MNGINEFYLFAEHHEVNFNTAPYGVEEYVSYCDGTDCNSCFLSNKNGRCINMGLLKVDEYNSLKENHPEYFI